MDRGFLCVNKKGIHIAEVASPSLPNPPSPDQNDWDRSLKLTANLPIWCRQLRRGGGLSQPLRALVRQRETELDEVARQGGAMEAFEESDEDGAARWERSIWKALLAIQLWFGST